MIVEQREQMKEEAKDLTVYEGRVPIHQRLRLLCFDFIESTRDFTEEEMTNFQSRYFETEHSIFGSENAKLERIVNELFHKY